MRLTTLALLTASAAVALAPTACNVFISFGVCSSDADCPAGCDVETRTCKPGPRPGPDGGSSSSGGPEGGTEAGPEGGPSVPPDAGHDAYVPPPCDLSAPFGSLAIVEGLDTTTTSARLSNDELTVYYSAQPGCPQESCVDLFFATRPDRSSPFVLRGSLPGDNISTTYASEYWPTISDDRTVLFFESSRSLDQTVYDQPRIWTATRPSPSSLAQFSTPVVQSLFRNGTSDAAPYLLPNGRELYFTSSGRPGGKGSLDLYVATIGELGEATTVLNLAPLNTDGAESIPVVAADGLTLYFAREEGGLRRVWKSVRSSPVDVFGAPAPLTELELLGSDQYPSWISPDQCRLYFGSDRLTAAEVDAGATNYRRIWVASRPAR